MSDQVGNPEDRFSQNEAHFVSKVLITLVSFLSTGLIPYEPRCEKTGLRGFRPCPTQTGLYSHRRWLEAKKFRPLVVDELYYLYSENKGTDLRLCFRICEKPVFS